MTNLISSQLRLQDTKEKTISKIKNKVLQNLGSNISDILSNQFNNQFNGLLTQQQIKDLVEKQIHDILTNSKSLQGNIEGLGNEAIEQMTLDIEKEYLEMFFPGVQHVDEILSPEEKYHQLSDKKIALEKDISDLESKIQALETKIDEKSRFSQVSLNEEFSDIDIDTLLNKETTTIFSELSACNFDIESIEDDNVYNDICTRIIQSEFFTTILSGKFRINKIPDKILNIKNILKNFCDIIDLLENNSDLKNCKNIGDILEYGEKNNSELADIQIQQKNYIESKNNKEKQIEEIETDLESYTKSDKNKENNHEIIDKKEYVLEQLKKISDELFGDDLKYKQLKLFDYLQSTLNINDSEIHIHQILVHHIMKSIVVLSTPDNILDNLAIFERKIGKKYIEKIFVIHLTKYYSDTSEKYFGLLFPVIGKYKNIELSNSILVNINDIPKIRELPGYNDAVVKKLMIHNKIAINIGKNISIKRDVMFGINLKKLRKYPKFKIIKQKEHIIGFYIDAETKQIGLSQGAFIPGDVFDTILLAKDMNKLSLKEQGLLIKEAESKNNNGVEKLINSSFQETIDYFSIDEENNTQLKSETENNIICEVIGRLNNAEVASQGEFVDELLKMQEYFKSIGEESLDKSLGKKLKGFGNSKGFIGIILKNDRSLFKKYLENNSPEILEEIQNSAQKNQISENEILGNILQQKKSKLEKRIFALHLGKDYRLKNLKNFDYDELVQYYNMTFVRHSVKDFEDLMNLSLTNFDKKITIRNPNAEPFNYDIESGSNIKEFGKLYKIIESLNNEGIFIEDGYNITTKSHHYICYIKEYNKFIITSDTVGAVFIFDGNAIEDIGEFGKKSLRELVSESKGVEKKYNYAEHEDSFYKILHEIKKVDFGYFSQQNENDEFENLSIECNNLESSLDIFTHLYDLGIIKIKDSSSLLEILTQWNKDVLSLIQGEQTEVYYDTIKQISEDNSYELEQLLIGNFSDKNNFYNYSVDAIYYALGGNIKNVRSYKKYSLVEEKYLDALVSNRKFPGENQELLKIENNILKNSFTAQDNQYALNLLSHLDEEKIKKFIGLYHRQSSVKEFEGIKFKHGIQSKVSLSIALGINDSTPSDENLFHAITIYKDKLRIYKSIVNGEDAYVDQIIDGDYNKNEISKYFPKKENILHFLGLDNHLSNEEIKSEIQKIQEMKELLNTSIHLDEIISFVDQLSSEDINTELLHETISIHSSDKITIEEIQAITNTDQKFDLESIKLSGLSPKQIEYLNYLMSQKCTKGSLTQYQLKLTVKLLANKFLYNQ